MPHRLSLVEFATDDGCSPSQTPRMACPAVTVLDLDCSLVLRSIFPLRFGISVLEQGPRESGFCCCCGCLLSDNLELQDVPLPKFLDCFQETDGLFRVQKKLSGIGCDSCLHASWRPRSFRVVTAPPSVRSHCSFRLLLPLPGTVAKQ